MTQTLYILLATATATATAVVGAVCQAAAARSDLVPLRVRASRPRSERRDRSQRGASLVEYALLLSLIALVCVGAIALVGNTTGDRYSSFASYLE